jgi:uridine phosphorylase
MDNRPIPASELILNSDGSIYHLHLKPENLASLVFTVGDPDRVALVSRYFDRVDFKIQKREFITHTGVIGNRQVTVMSTGMGTDNIEILMTELDALVNIDLENRTIKSEKKSLQIIRIGTSGSMQKDVPIGTFLASKIGIGLDTLMQFYPDLLGSQELAEGIQNELHLPFRPYQTQANPTLLGKLTGEFVQGVTLTCPGFYGPQGRKLRLAPRIDQMIERLSNLDINGNRLTNFEMETAGYYAMGELLGHQMLSLNAIVANRPLGQFDPEADKTIDRLIQRSLEIFTASS